MAAPFADRYGPWAVITGASSGLGEAFAHAVAARGIQPLLVARRADELARVSASVERSSGLACRRLSLDLADPAAADMLLDATADVDVGLVIGNAGFNPPGAFAEHDRALLERVLDVNARANLLLAHGFLPRLAARGRGGLLLVSSVEGYFGVPYSTAYAASKAYVLSLAEGLWGEARRSGVDVLALVPGPLDTPLFRSRGVRVPAMAPRTAAELALDQLGGGPSYVPARLDRWMFRILRALPRRSAVRLMGCGMRRTVGRLARPGR
jgi:short-subunit dehydrogenase